MQIFCLSTTGKSELEWPGQDLHGVDVFLLQLPVGLPLCLGTGGGVGTLEVDGWGSQSGSLDPPPFATCLPESHFIVSGEVNSREGGLFVVLHFCLGSTAGIVRKNCFRGLFSCTGAAGTFNTRLSMFQFFWYKAIWIFCTKHSKTFKNKFVHTLLELI